MFLWNHLIAKDNSLPETFGCSNNECKLMPDQLKLGNYEINNKTQKKFEYVGIMTDNLVVFKG